MKFSRAWRTLLSLALVALSSPLFAQQTGTISGKVTDTSGGVLPGVTVEALSEAIDRTTAGRSILVTVRPFSDVVPVVMSHVRPGDLVITLGAGSIGAIGDRILAELRAARRGGSGERPSEAAARH